MAEVITKFDTKTKKLEATIDGKAIPDTSDISFYRYKDYDSGDWMYSCSISTMTEDKENKTQTINRVYASHDPKAKASASVKSAISEEFVSIEENKEKLTADIHNYLGE